MGRYLGVDFGARRIGLATADQDIRIASPAVTVGSAELTDWIEKEGPFDIIVVGLPRGLDGAETPQTLAARRFAAEVLEPLGTEVVLQDEAGTSSVAESRLRESGRPYRPEQIDAEAAAIILQDYLETLI